ncbi:hypothetical protein DMN91_009915 [Ooceraea biroi]|uniref:Odorant receptor n=1 Tax=Ooceraea biroi TaxID=2015173 RepID=A0A3L8DCS3_OOCBI|nr:uncharacterized protein LOC105285766 isoform X2 [Ooceraea biroi]RLU17679.1 hypothetical protein DMN91_009915 [Ooceraea biroi]
MAVAGAHCFNLHRILFMTVGLWPYQKTFIWQIQAVFFFGAYFSMLFFQFTPFLTTTCNTECMVKRISYISITVVSIMNYYLVYFNSEAVKQVFQHMQFDWKMFKNTAAMKIFEEFLFESYIFALFLCFTFVITSFVLTLMESTPMILDVIAPMNDSRPRNLELDFEFFIFNEEQYFFFLLLLEGAAAGFGVWSLLAIFTFFTTVMKHSCATYKIVSYLIQDTVPVYMLQLPVVQRIQYMHRNICLSVYLHRRTLEFCKGLLLSFDIWLFPLLLVYVLSLSCVLFRVYNGIIQFNGFHDVVLSCGLLVCYLGYMFTANWFAQSYTDHSVEVLESTYDALWYVAPLPIQKLFLMMQTSIKSHKLVLGGLFVGSMEGFSTLVTSAISYFTVLHAMQL